MSDVYSFADIIETLNQLVEMVETREDELFGVLDIIVDVRDEVQHIKDSSGE